MRIPNNHIKSKTVVHSIKTQSLLDDDVIDVYKDFVERFACIRSSSHTGVIVAHYIDELQANDLVTALRTIFPNLK